MSADNQQPTPVPNDPISQRAAWWFQMARTVGWPGTVLILLALGAWRFAGWFEPRASKLIDTHIETVTSLKSQSEKQTSILGELNESQKTQGDMIRDIHRAVVKPQAVAQPGN